MYTRVVNQSYTNPQQSKVIPSKQNVKKKQVLIKQRTETASYSSEEPGPNENPYTMTEEILKKRYKHPGTGRFITQLFVAVVACIASFSFGTLLAWSRIDSSVYPKSNITSNDVPWEVSLMPLGCSLAFAPSFYIIKNLGPKKTMIFETPFYVLSFLIVLRTSSIQFSFMASRFVTGFMGTIYVVSAERLLTEAVHKRNLMRMLIFLRTSMLLGLLVSYIFGYYQGGSSLTIFCMCVPIVNIFLVAVLPESPVFLYKKNLRYAIESLQWYQGPTSVHAVEINVDKYKTGSVTNKYIFFSKCVLKAIILIAITNFFKVFSGYYVFILYNLPYHEERLIVYNNFTDSIIFMSSLILFNLVMDFGRPSKYLGVRISLIISNTIVTLSILAETIYLYMLDTDFVDTVTSKKYCVQTIILSSFLIGYYLGLEQCPNTLLHEYLPYQIQFTAKHIINTIYWLSIFCLTRFYSLLSTWKNHHVGFMVLSSMSCIGIVYFYIFIVECKGKPLVQIQIEIGGNPVGNRGSYRTRTEGTLMQNIL